MKSVVIMKEFMNEGKVATHQAEWRLARKSLILFQSTDLTSERRVCFRQMINYQGNMA